MAIRLSPEHQSAFSAVQGGTCETMPRHIWMHEVELFAARAGVDHSIITEWHESTLRDYQAGASVWIAVSTLVTVQDVRKTASYRVPSPREQIRSALRANEEYRARAGLGPGR